MIELWNKNVEKDFFEQSLKIAPPEKLFYTTDDNKYLAYWPKGYKGKKSTLQSRNSIIGSYTEKWVSDIMNQIVAKDDLFAIPSVVCPEIELTDSSPADVVISRKKGKNQRAEDILLIIEVKMSIVWNWQYNNDSTEERLICLGDYTTHQGNPGLLRSDSMLKAIGKSINLRVSSDRASQIPILVITNTPITNYYYNKVDNIKKAGIVQGFLSVNPKPLESGNESLKYSDGFGFYRFDSFNELSEYIKSMLETKIHFFSGMKTTAELGKIIEIANREKEYEKKGQIFLNLIRG